MRKTQNGFCSVRRKRKRNIGRGKGGKAAGRNKERNKVSAGAALCVCVFLSLVCSLLSSCPTTASYSGSGRSGQQSGLTHVSVSFEVYFAEGSHFHPLAMSALNSEAFACYSECEPRAGMRQQRAHPAHRRPSRRPTNITLGITFARGSGARGDRNLVNYVCPNTKNGGGRHSAAHCGKTGPPHLRNAIISI